MGNKYPRLISWEYWDGTSIFTRKKEKEEITEYYILNAEGEKEIEDGTLTNKIDTFARRINRVNFKKVTRFGYTKNSKKYKDIYFDMKNKYPELENKLKTFDGMLKDCGSYVYINLPWLDGIVDSFVSKHKDVFLNSNPNYIKKEFWDIELVNSLIDYEPRSLMGGIIKDYQEKHVPAFLLNLKVKFPELYNKLDRKTDKDSRELFLGKYVPVTKLNVGNVGNIKGVLFLTDQWHYDGEYLNGTKIENNLTVELRIKATDDVIVKVTDVNTVPIDLKL